MIWVRKDAEDGRGTLRDSSAYAMQRLFRLEAAYPAMDAGVFRERRNEDGPGVVEKEQYGDFSVVEQVLRSSGVKMDFESNADLRYNHRRDGDTDIYFVANPAGLALDAACTFRVSGKQPEIWDPITGTTRLVEDFTENDGRTIDATPVRVASIGLRRLLRGGEEAAVCLPGSSGSSLSCDRSRAPGM